MAPYPLQKRNPAAHHQPGNIESDSVNENFSPLRTGARRKRKMKRMDCDPAELASVPAAPPSVTLGPAEAAAIFSTPVELPSSLPLGLARLSLPGPSGIRVFGKKKKSKDSEGYVRLI